MEYIYGNPNKAHSWKNAASIFAAHDSLNSAQTSSLPLVQFWRPSGKNFDGQQLNPDALKLLEKCLGKDDTYGGAQLCFEYAVPVHSDSGRGKASMTDLMILTEKRAIAVEAKWTECEEPYAPTINDWLGGKQETTDNRKNVLDGWIEYINKYLKKQDPSIGEIDADKIDDTVIPYQLLHRIASACAAASSCTMADKAERKEERMKEAAVIYQLFYNDKGEKDEWKSISYDKTQEFKADLQEGFTTLFKDLKKPVPIQFCIIKTKVARGEGFDAAMEKCKKDGDLNELFLEMQHLNIYSFSPDAK